MGIFSLLSPTLWRVFVLARGVAIAADIFLAMTSSSSPLFCSSIASIAARLPRGNVNLQLTPKEQATVDRPDRTLGVEGRREVNVGVRARVSANNAEALDGKVLEDSSELVVRRGVVDVVDNVLERGVRVVVLRRNVIGVPWCRDIRRPAYGLRVVLLS